MPWVEKDASGNVVTELANSRPGATWVADTDPALVAYRTANPTIPAGVLIDRMKFQTVNGVNGWNAYVQWMLPVGSTLTAAQHARRAAFTETFFVGRPITKSDTAFRTSLTGAGFGAVQVDAVLA